MANNFEDDEQDEGPVNEMYTEALGNILVEANCNCRMNRFTLEIFTERSGYPQDFALVIRHYAELLEKKRTLVDIEESDRDN